MSDEEMLKEANRFQEWWVEARKRLPESPKSYDIMAICHEAWLRGQGINKRVVVDKFGPPAPGQGVPFDGKLQL